MIFSNRLFLIATLFSLLAINAIPASATSGKQYFSKRNSVTFDRKLTYTEASGNPAAYVGRVFELKGVVGGVVSGENGGVSIMLNLADSNSVMLDVPANELSIAKDSVTQDIRALVQVKDGATGNVVPLKTLMIVRESAAHYEEQLSQAKIDATSKTQERRRNEEERWRREMGRAFRSKSLRGVTPAIPTQTVNLASASAYPGLSARAQPLFTHYFRFIANHNPKLTSAQAGQIAYHLLNFADRYNVDPRLVVAMIIAESDFDPNCTSHTGAVGLGQLMPQTARELGVNNPYDPVQNLAGSVAYLRSRLDTFPDKTAPGGTYSFQQVALTMAAYNAGTGAVKKYNGVPPYRETQAYVKRVTSLYQQLCQ